MKTEKVVETTFLCWSHEFLNQTCSVVKETGKGREKKMKNHFALYIVE